MHIYDPDDQMMTPQQSADLQSDDTAGESDELVILLYSIKQSHFWIFRLSHLILMGRSRDHFLQGKEPFTEI